MNEKKKRNLGSLFNNRTFVIILSLVIAIVCWASVAFSQNTEMEKTLTGVPITISDTASFTNYGLSVLNTTIPTVDVRVRGARAAVGALTNSSVIVTPVTTNVSVAGTYELALTYAKTNPLDTSFDILSISPATVTLQFGTAKSTSFKIETNDIVASAVEGYIVEKISTDPAEITITGAAEEIARIARVGIERYVFEEELASTRRIKRNIVLYDTYGNEISQENFRIDKTEVDVVVVVYKLGTLKLTVDFVNVPDGFDVSTLDYKMSMEEVEVAGTEAIIDSRTEAVVGYIDLSTLTLGSSYDFEVNFANEPGIVMRGAQSITVTVTFPNEGLASKKINISDIRMINKPANYSITLVTTTITNVTVIGREADIEALAASSVIGIIDFSTFNIEGAGRRAVAVNFRIPSSNATWVAGSYTVIIEVEIR